MPIGSIKIALIAGLGAAALNFVAAPVEAAKFSGRERYDGISRWDNNYGYYGAYPYSSWYGWTGGYPAYTVLRPRWYRYGYRPYGYYGWGGYAPRFYGRHW